MTNGLNLWRVPEDSKVCICAYGLGIFKSHHMRKTSDMAAMVAEMHPA